MFFTCDRELDAALWEGLVIFIKFDQDFINRTHPQTFGSKHKKEKFL